MSVFWNSDANSFEPFFAAVKMQNAASFRFSKKILADNFSNCCDSDLKLGTTWPWWGGVHEYFFSSLESFELSFVQSWPLWSVEVNGAPSAVDACPGWWPAAFLLFLKIVFYLANETLFIKNKCCHPTLCLYLMEPNSLVQSAWRSWVWFSQ